MRFQVPITPCWFMYSGMRSLRWLNSYLSFSSIPTCLRIFFFMLSGGSVVHFRDACSTDYGNVETGVELRNNLKSGFSGSVMYFSGD